MKVAIIKDDRLDYCYEAPYHPGDYYPEYPFSDTSHSNATYKGVRDLLYLLGMDKDNFGKASWNPLGSLIRPGNSVLIKPNMVMHYNPAGGTEQLITHGSIIRAIVDYAYIALKGSGSITIADAPNQSADFEILKRITGIDKIAGFYGRSAGFRINILDLRKEKGYIRRTGGRVKEPLKGDPLGYSIIDLKEDSELEGITLDRELFRVADYDKNEVLKHHDHGRHEYCISNSVLNADLVISLPKLKTHGKTGMTCALKNFVGINGYKDWLPHYRAGSLEEGGDEYFHKDIRKSIFQALNYRMNASSNPLYVLPLRALSLIMFYTRLLVPFSDDILNGACCTNDTIPRTVTDLNKIVLYADKNGVMRNTQQRKLFIVVDSIVAGEKEGPLKPAPKKCGVLVAGYDPVRVDIVCSKLMGFDYKKMPLFSHALHCKKYSISGGSPEDVQVVSDRCRCLDDVYREFNCNFVPATGWKGYVECSGGGREELTVPARLYAPRRR